MRKDDRRGSGANPMSALPNPESRNQGGGIAPCPLPAKRSSEDSASRIESCAWIAALCLLTVGPGGLPYSACLFAGEMIIFGLFVRSLGRRRAGPDALIGRLAAVWIISEAASTAFSYVTRYGIHSPYAAQIYAGGFYGPVRLLVDTSAGIAAFFTVWRRRDIADSNAPSPLHRAVPILLAATGVAVLCGVEQARNVLFGTDDPRIQATFTNPNVLAAFLCLSLPLAAGAAFSPELPRRSAARMSLFLLTAALLAALALTQSRGALLGCTVGFVYLGAALWAQRGGNAFQRARRGQFAVKAIAGACIGIAACGFFVLPHLLHSGRSASDGQRIVAWRAAILMIDASPILGIGVNGYPAAMGALRLLEPNPDTPSGLPQVPAVHLHAHDLVLQAWVERGLLGAGTVVSLIILLLRKSVRDLTIIRSKAGAVHPVTLGATGCLLATMTQNVTDYTLWFAPIGILMWYVLGLMFAPGETNNRDREDYAGAANN